MVHNYYITDARFELYSSGRLKWACGLKVGDDVKVRLGRNNEPVTGVIRGSGTRLLPYVYGLQFIVEITVKPSLARLNPLSLAAKWVWFSKTHFRKPHPPSGKAML